METFKPGWQVWTLTQGDEFKTNYVLRLFLVETMKSFCFDVTAIGVGGEQKVR